MRQPLHRLLRADRADPQCRCSRAVLRSAEPPPALKVNNTVSVFAEYQCAVNISRTVPVVGLCRIIAPNDAVCGQCGGFGQLNGICIRIIRGFGIQRVFIAPDMNGVAADGEIFFLRFGGRVLSTKVFDEVVAALTAL